MSIYAWASGSLPASTLNDFVSPVGILTATLASYLQNGKSSHGLLPSPDLPKYLGSSVIPPWKNRTVNGSSPTDPPNTGLTRYYDFTIERGIIAPDGLNRSVILINDQFPGPTIEANWGDYIEVTVHNKIKAPEEGTTLQWHGLSQAKTPWFDGTPSITQCPIAPGSSFTYRFQADTYGTTWYHSHYSAQHVGGLYGPMIIYGPTHADYDYDLGPIILSDYFHQDYYTLVQNTMSDNPYIATLTPAQNTLIQGKGMVDCSLIAKNEECTSWAGFSKFNFTAGKTHRLRLINPSAVSSPILFSIDNHTLTVIANDFTPIIPYETDVVRISSGQRTDILVTASADPGSVFWMRSRQPDLCNFVLQPFGLAGIYYNEANPNAVPRSLPHPDFNTALYEDCANDPLEKTVPAYKITPSLKPDTTITITAAMHVNATNHTLYTMNGESFRADFNDPLLGIVNRGGNLTFPVNSNVYNFGSNETIRIIFKNTLPFSHPMHLHGQQFSVLAEGVGEWDGTIVNPENPQRRDTQILQARGYMVAQLTAHNPGAWTFHCQIAWHISAGMSVTVLLKPDEIKQKEIPKVLKKTCDAWNSYTKKNSVNQIDSGLK